MATGEVAAHGHDVDVGGQRREAVKPDTQVETNVFTSGFTSSLPIFMGTRMSRPHTRAPRTSEGMLSSGVAFSIGICTRARR